MLLTDLKVADVGGCQAILASEMGKAATQEISAYADIGDATTNDTLVRFVQNIVYTLPTIARADRNRGAVGTVGDIVHIDHVKQNATIVIGPARVGVVTTAASRKLGTGKGYDLHGLGHLCDRRWLNNAHGLQPACTRPICESQGSIPW